MNLVFASFGALMFALGNGLVNDPPEPNPLPPTFNMIATYVLQPYCMNCHTTTPGHQGAAGIDLSLYEDMMKSNAAKNNSKHAPFIIAEDADHSKLCQVLRSHVMPKNNTETPLLFSPSQDEIKAVCDWIDSGAQNN